jgi:peptidyl-prolyl cis-trans isomerase SurA
MDHLTNMKRFLALAVIVLAAGAVPAWAQRIDQLPGMSPAAPQFQDRVAAVVNDNVISTSDIESRMKLAFLSSGLPDTLEVRQHLLPQILRGLIDEQLQMQEAKRLDITVSNEELDKTLQRIAEDNHISGGDMRAYLKERGASPSALEQQVRAGLSWNKVIQRELRSRVDVGDDEIETAVSRIRASAGKQEFLVSEIFLSVDSAKDEDQVKQVADNLVQQMKGGANFAAVARQFSQSTGAASGGDIGWIQEGQLSPELNRTLAGMQAGEVAGPVRSASGWHILALREKRTIAIGSGESGDVTLNLQQAFRPIPPRGDRASALQEAQQIRSSIGDCSSLQSRLAEKFPAWHLQATDGVKLSQAPSWLADKVRDLSVGKSSEALNTDKGLLVIFVCGRHAPDGNKIDRDAIASSIGTEKLELQARRLLRDLRRAAYLDIRLGSGS